MNAQTIKLAPEVARELGVTSQTIHEWRRDGRFPNAFPLGERQIAFTSEDVEAVRKDEANKCLERLQQLGYTATLSRL